MEAAQETQSFEVLPPTEPRTIVHFFLVALSLAGFAAVLGLFVEASTIRLLLVATGMLVGASALSIRPDLWWVWLAAAGVALLASFGLPNHWDSAQMLSRVLCCIFAVAAGLILAAPNVRAIILSAAILFHFGGILTATTWPDPAPWITTQAAYRVYLPYLTFMYLRNAYHFYSPEPGPANHLFYLLTYETDEIDPTTGQLKTISEWRDIPRRDANYRDPLGLTYYRRLSLTEMVAATIPSTITPETVEKNDAVERRKSVAVGVGRERIPIDPRVDPIAMQYRIPRPDISRYLLPSYARHIAMEHSGPGRKVVSVKLFRVEHRVLGPTPFIEGTNPYHPLTYRPYYLGEYNASGELVNPMDPMLYWLVPLVPRETGPSLSDEKQRDYIDYMSKYVGYEFEWRKSP